MLILEDLIIKWPFVGILQSHEKISIPWIFGIFSLGSFLDFLEIFSEFSNPIPDPRDFQILHFEFFEIFQRF